MPATLGSLSIARGLLPVCVDGMRRPSTVNRDRHLQHRWGDAYAYSTVPRPQSTAGAVHFKAAFLTGDSYRLVEQHGHCDHPWRRWLEEKAEKKEKEEAGLLRSALGTTTWRRRKALKELGDIDEAMPREEDRATVLGARHAFARRCLN